MYLIRTFTKFPPFGHNQSQTHPSVEQHNVPQLTPHTCKTGKNGQVQLGGSLIRVTCFNKKKTQAATVMFYPDDCCLKI